MSKVDCSSCDDLRKISTSFINNGVTTTICNSLKNDTGLNPNLTVLHTDCEDLDTVNDCLVGVMDSDLEKYDACDWIKFMHRFIPNLHTTFKTIICAICGLWTNIHSILSRLNSIDNAITALTRRVTKNEGDISALQSRVTTIGNTVANHTTEITNIWKRIGEIEDQSGRIDCIIDNMTKQRGWNVGPDNIRWAPGVTARAGVETDPLLAVPHMSGNGYCGYMTGSISISQTWIDAHPNSELNTRGALLYEYRIKLSDFKLKNIFAFNLQENANGQCVHAHGYIFKAGDTTFGNNKDDTTGSSVVPAGYIYIQVRMASYESLGNGDMTLSGVMPVITDISKLDC